MSNHFAEKCIPKKWQACQPQSEGGIFSKTGAKLILFSILISFVKSWQPWTTE